MLLKILNCRKYLITLAALQDIRVWCKCGRQNSKCGHKTAGGEIDQSWQSMNHWIGGGRVWIMSPRKSPNMERGEKKEEVMMYENRHPPRLYSGKSLGTFNQRIEGVQFNIISSFKFTTYLIKIQWFQNYFGIDILWTDQHELGEFSWIGRMRNSWISIQRDPDKPACIGKMRNCLRLRGEYWLAAAKEKEFPKSFEKILCTHCIIRGYSDNWSIFIWSLL